MERLSSSLMGKKLTNLTFEYTEYDKITKWLMENANIYTYENMEIDDATGNITLKVQIDDVVY